MKDKEQQKLQAVPFEQNLTPQKLSREDRSFKANKQSSQKSLSVKSQMSDRTMDKLERANHRLNEKMLRASIDKSKEIRGSFAENKNALSEMDKPKRRNMFSKSPKSFNINDSDVFNDVNSTSKS